MTGSIRKLKIFLLCLIAGFFAYLIISAQGHFSSQAMLAQIDQPNNQEQAKEEEQPLIPIDAKPIKKGSAFVLETGAISALSLLVYPESQENIQPKILFKKRSIKNCRSLRLPS
jgi:hypothetical protein